MQFLKLQGETKDWIEAVTGKKLESNGESAVSASTFARRRLLLASTLCVVRLSLHFFNVLVLSSLVVVVGV